MPRAGLYLRQISIFLFVASLALLVPSLSAQIARQITRQIDSSQLHTLENHHPQWANAANSIGPLPQEQVLDQLTLVLTRSSQRQLAFEEFLADQQNPASKNYHHWLTPAEVGERFGLSDADLGTISEWLQAQGLHINWISPSRTFIGFGGTAADIERAFQTTLRNYRVDGVERMSISSDPMIPAALAPAIKAVYGLYTIEDHPAHARTATQLASPQMSISSKTHYISPGDFAAIYDLPSSLRGSGTTIGIVGRSRTDTADFQNFMSKTGTSFMLPVEVVPTAFGGADPGPALTAPPTTGVSIDDQSEATLDVLRAGSVAPGANLLLVVAAQNGGGIAAAAQYLVQSSPVPAQVMTISFGACESSVGRAGVAFWDTLFQQAAAEGISTFVASGDSGASGCDAAFATPPANPSHNSPNYICSSSYATCVGGTGFNDTNASEYWSTSNDPGLASAYHYIPEGAWNEPLGSSSRPQAAASGGGVSSFLPTPAWQTGAGVPAARSGRYTPDVSFASSCHDAYFGCFAAGGASCVSQGDSYTFFGFCGTSNAAPSMAGIAALLDQQIGTAQGNLNPKLYQLAGSSSSFHDVTVASSGVQNCSAATPSMCNNSAPSPDGLTGGQPGYLLTDGYDQVTGLGSLDVQAFFSNFSAKPIPSVTVTPSADSITVLQPLIVTVTVSIPDSNTVPTGSVILSSGNYLSVAVTLNNGSASITIPSGALPPGTNKLTVSYSPDATSTEIYNSASGAVSIVVNRLTPILTLTPSTSNISTAKDVTVTVSASSDIGSPAPTGSISLFGGNYSNSVLLSGNTATFSIAAGLLPAGTASLTASYSPDTRSYPTYNSTSASRSITVNGSAPCTPKVNVTPQSSNITNTQALPVAVSVTGNTGTAAPSGLITLISGDYSSTTAALSTGNATVSIPAGKLAVGTDKLIAIYTPDTASSSTYNNASGLSYISVVGAGVSGSAPGFTISGTPLSFSQGATDIVSTITVTPNGGFTGAITLTATIASGPSGAKNPPTLSFGSSNSVNIAGTVPVTASLTICTTGPASIAQLHDRKPQLPWYATSGATFACLLIIIPIRGSNRRILALLLLFSAITGGLIGCGTNTGIRDSSGSTGNTGTTKGTYLVTITGIAGNITETNTISVTVQ